MKTETELPDKPEIAQVLDLDVKEVPSFPPVMAELLELCSNENTIHLIAVISLANFLSWTQGMGSFDVIRPPILQPAVREFIDPKTIDFKAVIELMDREMEKTAQFYNFVFPSASQFRENLLKASLDLCHINTLYFYSLPGKGKSVDPSEFKNSIMTPHRSLEPAKIISTTLAAINLDFSLDRLYVMTIIKKTRRLKVISFVDSTQDPVDLKSIEIPIARDSGGFIKCLRDKEPVVISGENDAEKEALAQLNAKNIVIVPFCSNNKVIGILGMDNAVSGKPIPPEIISSISIVAGELGMPCSSLRIRPCTRQSRKDGTRSCQHKSKHGK